MKEDKFVIWSDGAITSMGVVADGIVTGDKMLIKDPVSVIFSTSEMQDEDGKMQGRLNFEMIPYIFGALVNGDNVWSIDARHVLQNSDINEQLKMIYYHTIRSTSNVKRADNGDVQIEAK